MIAKFPIGQLVATPGALQRMDDLEVGPRSLIVRHVAGDWGVLDDEDRKANDQAVEHDGRLLSNYRLCKPDCGNQFCDHRIWIITEWDRSATTILLPEDY